MTSYRVRLIILLFSVITGISAKKGYTETENILSFSIASVHGIQIPRLGFGTAGLGALTDHVVHTALNMGVRLIDSAQAKEWYDEARVGKGLRFHMQRQFETNDPAFLHQHKATDDGVVVVTKIHPRSFAADKMQAAILRSKRELYGSEDARPIDVVLIHSPFCWPNHCSAEEEHISWKEGWRNLERTMSAGHVLSIGVSNFGVSELKELLRISNTKISVIQNWMDPFRQDREVRQLAEEHGIIYMAYSSFGTQWEGKFHGANPVFTDDILHEIANKHGTTISSVVLSWLLQEGVVAIPRSEKTEHIRQNAAPIMEGKAQGGLRVFLDDADMELIRNLDGIHGTPWDSLN